jgi:hypothetical protein
MVSIVKILLATFSIFLKLCGAIQDFDRFPKALPLG